MQQQNTANATSVGKSLKKGYDYDLKNFWNTTLIDNLIFNLQKCLQYYFIIIFKTLINNLNFI